MEVQEYFSFFAKDYRFMPAFKNRIWDGKIRLYNLLTKTLYKGLLDEVKAFADLNEYTVEIDPSFSQAEFSLEEAREFVKTLKLKYEPYDYQLEAFVHAVRNNRSMTISPTASGKSLIIYLLLRYYKKRTMIVVPTTTLVHQLFDDFKDYGFDSDTFCHKIVEGAEKKTNKPFIICTWQSVYKEPKKFFDKFELIIGDEAHEFKAKSLTSIMEKATECKYRHGLTGTLDGSLTNETVLKGLFGPKRQATTTKEMMDTGKASVLSIKALVLEYPDEFRKAMKDCTYKEEVDFLCQYKPRNKFIKNLALSLEGNTIVIFRFTEHGKTIYEMIKEQAGDRPVYFVNGDIKGTKRNDIRSLIEEQTNAIVVASIQTFGTGINIKNLPNIIFTSPSKSRVKVLQAIGRVLRKTLTKTKATLYDIADDLSWKAHKNYTIKHFIERVNMYVAEKFKYKLYNISLK
jgi:superfamily II DNA or RNA helicase